MRAGVLTAEAGPPVLVKPEREAKRGLRPLPSDPPRCGAGWRAAGPGAGPARAGVPGILGAALLVNHSPVWSWARKPDSEKALLLLAGGAR